MLGRYDGIKKSKTTDCERCPLYTSIEYPTNIGRMVGEVCMYGLYTKVLETVDNPTHCRLNLSNSCRIRTNSDGTIVVEDINLDRVVEVLSRLNIKERRKADEQ